MKKRLIIVANRLPVNVTKKNKELRFTSSVGGLATGLESIYGLYECLWIGWPGIPLERLTSQDQEEIQNTLRAKQCYPVFLNQREIDQFYHGFSNKCLWPLFHYFPGYTIYNEGFWKSYNHVNELYCQTVIEHYDSEDLIWIHDYHLLLLPDMVRNIIPTALMGFFLHIPFPSFEIFRLLPWRRELLQGMMGADLIGFHTYDYVRHFLNSVRRFWGYDHTFGQILTRDRMVWADVFPMGIDYERFAHAAQQETEVQREIHKIQKKVKDYKVILSVDRLDYTKGIRNRLEAFDLLLEKVPAYREKIILILVVVPSRIGVEQYDQLKRQLDETVGKINGKYGSLGWTPIWYLYHSFNIPQLTALYNTSQVALVTPLRDGMNLIAKEFIASQSDGLGVLILSEMAGAASELGEAIIVNPNNINEIAAAIRESLEMPETEQIRRNRIMQRRLKRYDIQRWVSDFIDRLTWTRKNQQKVYVRKLSLEKKMEIKQAYRAAANRIIFLDYDGTLVPFSPHPQQARPDEEIRNLLTPLLEDARNEVVLISGRDKQTLEDWFDKINLHLVAEHGVWVRPINKDWSLLMPIESDWKEKIRPLMELYVDRTPGSLLEDKDYSLAWHYRRVEKDLALARVRELNDALMNYTANRKLTVIQGNRVIEVKNSGIDKGTAAKHWLMNQNWEFILALGDDWTDEELFEDLPESAFTIKVGLDPSRARFYVESYKDVRALLQFLTRSMP